MVLRSVNGMFSFFAIYNYTRCSTSTTDFTIEYNAYLLRTLNYVLDKLVVHDVEKA